MSSLHAHAVCLLEEDDQLAESILTRLQERGWVAERCESIEAMLSQRHWITYILSLSYPLDDPYEQIERLRALPHGSLISIFLIGSGDEAIRSTEEALRSGADGFYIKPVQIERLFQLFPPRQLTTHPRHVIEELGSTEALSHPEQAQRRERQTSPFSSMPPPVMPAPEERLLEPENQEVLSNLFDVADPMSQWTAGDPSNSLPMLPAFQPGTRLSLESFGFAAIFAVALNLRWTGTLALSHRGVEWRLCFSRGQLVELRSPELQALLLGRLVSESILSSEDAKQRGQSPELEARLLEEYELSPTRLYQLQRECALELLHELFTLIEGEVELREAEPLLGPLRLGDELELLLSGISIAYGRARLRQHFSSTRRAFQARPFGPLRERLPAPASQLLKQLEEAQTLDQLAGESTPSLQLIQQAYFLYLLGEIEGVQLEESPLQAFEELALHGDYLALLGVSPKSSQEELYQAWQRRRQEIDEAAERGSSRGRCQLLAAALDDAWVVLGHQSLREIYLDGITRPLSHAENS
ncbi:MAG: DUF4388 domain-containing protein [Myxococcota bacterium]|nr:DUF4388 domain-containing protein [Myxococcota bacterium]